MKYLEIQHVPYAPPERKYWIFSLEAGEDGQPLTGKDAPTNQVVGQYPSIEAALAAYPDAHIAESAQKSK